MKGLFPAIAETYYTCYTCPNASTSPKTSRHNLKPFSSSTSRPGTWHFAVALHEINLYFAPLWEQREKLQRIPKLILWGEKDKLLPLHFLDTWQQAFPKARVADLKAGIFFCRKSEAAKLRRR